MGSLEMTDASDKPMRFDLAGVCGCRGEQLFAFDGKQCDAGLGFEQDKSKKSVARNEMENKVRRLEREAGEDPPPPTAAELRALFVELCERRPTIEVAPLLGDALLLTYMTADYRQDGMSEREVRQALESDLRSSLKPAGARACLKYLRWFVV